MERHQQAKPRNWVLNFQRELRWWNYLNRLRASRSSPIHQQKLIIPNNLNWIYLCFQWRVQILLDFSIILTTREAILKLPRQWFSRIEKIWPHQCCPHEWHRLLYQVRKEIVTFSHQKSHRWGVFPKQLPKMIHFVHRIYYQFRYQWLIQIIKSKAKDTTTRANNLSNQLRFMIFSD